MSSKRPASDEDQTLAAKRPPSSSSPATPAAATDASQTEQSKTPAKNKPRKAKKRKETADGDSGKSEKNEKSEKKEDEREPGAKLKAALGYLRTWQLSRSSWRFQKVRQTVSSIGGDTEEGGRRKCKEKEQ